MHEYSIVEALVERVAQAARGHEGAYVAQLWVRIGEASGVEIPLLERAYEIFRERTICSRAELSIESVPAVWCCSGCGREVAKGEVLRCSECGQSARLVSGDEIILDRIELEVPDV